MIGSVTSKAQMQEELMIRCLLTTISLFLVGGCGVSPGKSDVDGFVPFAEDLRPLIGHWESDGQLALIVERDENRIAVRNPKNEVWRFEIENAKPESKSITFVQRSFLIDGSSHPFNGVPCNCKISPHPTDLNLLVYHLTSEYSNDIPPDTMRRAK